MSDIIDNANDCAELYLGVALRNAQAKVAPAPHGIGLCLNCGTETAGDARWCDPDCRDDWAGAQRRQERRITS